ncbi:trigger factor [[Clostridium] aminophilum]|uniref:Trigger factor n=1 Tax=[Clostridium] aminophilum TaxID=1526 RepID=A0A1I6IR11_9FIRM|nr:trigger factor [[Clostridium] aminophilum]SFR69192.1 trigger factor [[Clostridium] aminophilum]
MSVKVEKTDEKNIIKLTVEVPAEEFTAALNQAFNHNKKNINVPGFRKGHATRTMVEKIYGKGAFYEEAAQIVVNGSYRQAVEESKEDIVSGPAINIVEMEEGKTFVYEATVAVKPEVELGEYKGITVEKADDQVTDEDVENELKNIADRSARLVDVTGEIKSGDQTVIDFKGTVDGTAFSGGTAEDYPLTIGSNQFIPGFEDQIIGHKTGETFDVNVKFPEDYHAKDLAGKDAVFAVTVKSAKQKELPEINDEFADNHSEFSTLAEMKEDLKKKVQERKTAAAKTENENKVVEKVVENAKVELPQPMVDTECRSMIDNYANQLQSQGLSLQDYLKYTGQTIDSMMEQLKPNAVKNITTGLVLEAVAKAENIEVSDEDFEKEVQHMADQYKIELEQMKKFVTEDQKEQIVEGLARTKAIDFLVGAANLQ